MKAASDVTIVGAGPSGSYTALKLASKGIRVIVLEEHQEIGVPSHCAGHLSISGLARLGLTPLPSGIIENTFKGAIIHSPSGRQFSLNFEQPMTCSVNRCLFDKYLAELAKNAGVSYQMGARVLSLIVDKGCVRGVVIERKGEVEELRSAIVIDAEGAASRLLKQLRLPGPEIGWLVNGAKAEVSGIERLNMDLVEVFLSTDYAPGFYAWLIPTENGKAKIGLGAKHRDAKQFLERFVRRHPVASRRLGNAETRQIVLHPITLGGPIPQPYSEGFLAVGDAASQVKPTTGGGIILGLTCGDIAAEVASEAISKGSVTKDFLRAYKQKVEEALGFDFSVMLKLRRLLDIMTDRQLDDAIDFCSRFRLERALTNLKELDLQGRTMLRTLSSPQVAAVLGYFLYIYLSAKL